MFRSAFLLVLLLLSGCSAAVNQALLNTKAPTTRFSLLDGGAVALSSFRGAPVVITFWATTCPRSPKALDRLEPMARRLTEQGVRFLAVSLDTAAAEQELRELIAGRELNSLQHAFSGNAEYDEAYISFDGRELPYIVVVDAQGKIVALGSQPSVVSEYFAKNPPH